MSEDRLSIANFVLNRMASLSVKQSPPPRAVLLVNYNVLVHVNVAPRQQTVLQTIKPAGFVC